MLLLYKQRKRRKSISLCYSFVNKKPNSRTSDFLLARQTFPVTPWMSLEPALRLEMSAAPEWELLQQVEK